jgi:ribosomal protein L30/L7E
LFVFLAIIQIYKNLGMDFEKQIRILQNENEFLEEQIVDLNKEIEAKNIALSEIKGNESEAALRSRITMNKYEIEQLQYNATQAAKKLATMDAVYGEMEAEFLQEIKGRQKDKATLKLLNSVQANNQVLNEELDAYAGMFKKVTALKNKLKEASSLLDMKEIECQHLRNENAELKALTNQLLQKHRV